MADKKESKETEEGLEGTGDGTSADATGAAIQDEVDRLEAEAKADEEADDEDE